MSAPQEKYWTNRLKAEGRSVNIARFEKDVYTVTEDQKTAARERRNYGKRKRTVKAEV